MMAGRLSARGGFAGGSRLALSLGLALAFAASATGSRSALAQVRRTATGGASGSRSEPGSLHYTNKRSFKIPFDIDKEGRAKIKEVQLWSSEDRGEHWKGVSATTPDRPSFTFRASHDGEFWFAVRIMGLDGQAYPSRNDDVVPGMKVLVDTKLPLLVLEPEGRRGTDVAVRWEVRDENLDPRSLVIEYQAEGVREWSKVPVKKAALIGTQRWNVGTADAVKVRAFVADKAGNEAEANIVLKEGLANLPERSGDGGEDETPPPSIARGSDGPGILAGPGFGPVGEDVEENPAEAPRPRGPSGGRIKHPVATPRTPSRLGQAASDARRSVFEGAPVVSAGGGAGMQRPGPAEPGAGEVSVFDTIPASPGIAAVPIAANPAQPNVFGDPGNAGMAPAPDGPAGTAPQVQPVASPRFPLQYAVDDAGPNGRPASVELWVTRDGGRSWFRKGSDPDRTSPIDVDLGGEGTFGIRLVSRSAFGQGDAPPRSGDAPEFWVEVDSSPPLVQLYPITVGTGKHAGRIHIAWRATDAHLDVRATRLLWRADKPGEPWQPIADGQENTGQIVWELPQGCPSKIHVRVETKDTLGHVGSQETTDSGAILVDLSKPKSRIIGLDPNARAGAGVSASQMR